ncbi:GatB/YqeY domain-containing protein [Azospirillum brasilense]|uniref:GatB/YqeY domain-containing protein n=1 Tax=Azospirillum brasilense TaxID=192 RepID=A0A0P0F4S3_AZOBR|nr:MULTISPECIES: GatB/YqeY domain-containing protein [Azospirillum]ALJ35695.1 glutamyl-tRNA amidotransferase [Azospirillum brasilense]MDW7554961.1 GatB/YqeY domain-containing protein [Azospirillum brasilense]MDW7594738.1 GatB/YqeY domain-containing protein [Azospirillum brasilense]MDW7629592.1 GatB/YqeY domain-containing protein [Azospirillum brasilense]MDX5954452.1 GatB/YqeY domain-containing protein [Azospirillum brasilense]
MLRTRLNEALKQAMLAKNQRAVSTVRLILAALKDRDIAARSRGVTDGIDEAEILSMLQTMIKQRGESIKLYEQGGRLELAEQEREEITIIEGFLPKQMSDEEVAAAVKTVVDEIGATCIKDMGKVMAELKARYAGQMDFAKVSGTVKQQLSAC